MLGRLFLTVVLVSIASAVLLYVCLATPVGPWAETITSLIAVVFAPVGLRFMRSYDQDAAYATIASGMAGIVATAIGFALPTIYFVAPEQFNLWLAHPWDMVRVFVFLALASGAIGITVAQRYDRYLRVDQKLPFPVGDLVYKALTGMEERVQAHRLLIGSCTTIAYHAFTTWVMRLPHTLHLIAGRSFYFTTIPALTFPVHLAPMFISIGAVAGIAMAYPLLIGMVMRVVCAEPLRILFAPEMNALQAMISFGGGMAAYGGIHALIELVKAGRSLGSRLAQGVSQPFTHATITRTEIAMAASAVIALLLLGFSPVEALFVAGGAAVCAYQLAWIGGKIGLAPLGRFATFVMVPFSILFGLNPYKASLVATCVELSGGCAVDYLFGRVIVDKAGLKTHEATWWQWVGVILGAVLCAALLLIYTQAFGLGSTELACQRARGRALLIAAPQFHGVLLLCGIAASALLSRFKINSFLVLGGLLMPWDVSFLLILGGLCTRYIPRLAQYTSFYAGVFGTSALWMLIRALASR